MQSWFECGAFSPIVSRIPKHSKSIASSASALFISPIIWGLCPLFLCCRRVPRVPLRAGGVMVVWSSLPSRSAYAWWAVSNDCDADDFQIFHRCGQSCLFLFCHLCSFCHAFLVPEQPELGGIVEWVEIKQVFLVSAFVFAVITQLGL